jgi:hypothetical protein
MAIGPELLDGLTTESCGGVVAWDRAEALVDGIVVCFCVPIRQPRALGSCSWASSGKL